MEDKKKEIAIEKELDDDEMEQVAGGKSDWKLKQGKPDRVYDD